MAECQVRDHQSPSMAPVTEVINYLSCGRMITLNSFHHGRRSTLFFRNRHSEYRCAFPAHRYCYHLWTVTKRQLRLHLLRWKKASDRLVGRQRFLASRSDVEATRKLTTCSFNSSGGAYLLCAWSLEVNQAIPALEECPVSSGRQIHYQVLKIQRPKGHSGGVHKMFWNIKDQVRHEIHTLEWLWQKMHHSLGARNT